MNGKKQIKKSYNWKKAIDSFGKPYMEKLLKNLPQSNFIGDWEILGSLVKESENNKNKSISECQTNWIKWRNNYKSNRINFNINGVNLSYLDIRGINFNEVELEDVNFINTNLEESFFTGSQLKNINFNKAILINVDFSYSELNNIIFLGKMNMLKCKYNSSKMTNVTFNSTECSNSEFKNTLIENTKFLWSDLSKSRFIDSKLLNTSFYNSQLSYILFNRCYINDDTEFCKCEIDTQTKIENTNIQNSIMEDSFRSQLIYCNRKTNWEKIYQKDKIYGFLIKIFWLCSNYGYSTKRPLCLFFSISFFYSLLYFMPCLFIDSCGENAGFVKNLFIYTGGYEKYIYTFIRSFYFSIVTMTTLGFGDISANENSIIGHILLILQVLIGYFILAILVTRFSTLFTQNGPTVIPKKVKKKLNLKGLY